MSIKLIGDRLRQYSIQSKQDELNAIKEIIQKIALASLSRTEFFKNVVFQGGTCLRILYGLQRFSEGLDFILRKPDALFIWKHYLDSMKIEFESFGMKLEIKDRSKVDSTVKKAFIKEDSFVKILTLIYPRNTTDVQKIQIKFEIDTHPPRGSLCETKYVDFPYPFSVTLQDISSLFSGKCHALLCREYTKGRDWFDFIWYVSRKAPLNYIFFKNALFQTGPWKGQDLAIDKGWIINQLEHLIKKIDWDIAKKDVIRFLKPREAENLKIWSTALFLNMVKKLESYL